MIKNERRNFQKIRPYRNDMDKFTALLVEKNITRDDLLLILRSVKLNSGEEVNRDGEQNG